MKPKAFQLTPDGTGARLSGRLTMMGGRAVPDALAELRPAKGKLVLDMTDVTAMDTAGAMWLLRTKQRLEQNGSRVQFAGLEDGHAAMLERLEPLMDKPWPQKARRTPRLAALVAVGKFACVVRDDLMVIAALLGQVVVAFGEIAAGRRVFLVQPFVRHVREAGLMAVPIVMLISFLMSIVLAYQGVSQLAMFGAQRFAINLVAVSTLREMGGLLAAIMVAGRSGSSFTSEIGVMKIREEVDAMAVMGMDPLDRMILPRIAALMVALPLLTFFAFVAAMLGGALVSVVSLDIGLGTYLDVYAEAVTGTTMWIGMVKAPVFALFIGLISCVAGMQVGGSADSVGRQTTHAVVMGIFSVLVLDAMFSVLFANVGW